MTPTRPTSPPSTAIIDGLVLAAGRSSRMGRPKALLKIDDETFVERVIRMLIDGGCRAVVVVVGTDDAETVRRAEQAGAKVVVNPDAASEQSDSLRLGLGQLEDEAVAVAVLPVDYPLVRATTVARVLSAFRGLGAPITRPIYKGVPGHPTVFARSVFDDLARTDLAEGARTVVREHADAVVDVPVEDPGIAADVDTPEDYRRVVLGAC